MARYDLWTHGVSTVVEFPNTDTEIQNAGWGTRVRQPGNKKLWCHIPIPGPTIIEGNSDVRLKHIHLQADVNENARIRTIHFLVNGGRIFEQNVSLTNKKIDQVFGDLNVEIKGGLSLSIQVEFLSGTPQGEVTFRGAGARFES